MAETQAGTFKLVDAPEVQAEFVTFVQVLGEQLSKIRIY